MFVAPPMATMVTPSASLSRPRRAASASSARWSLTPSTNTTARTPASEALSGDMQPSMAADGRRHRDHRSRSAPSPLGRSDVDGSDDRWVGITQGRLCDDLTCPKPAEVGASRIQEQPGLLREREMTGFGQLDQLGAGALPRS
jgi:hypothetical protein